MVLPNWTVVLAGYELACFLIFGLSIATAIPESEIADGVAAVSNRKFRRGLIAHSHSLIDTSWTKAR
jgi:hypothetical protein